MSNTYLCGFTDRDHSALEAFFDDAPDLPNCLLT